jgi:tetratricopeptide (TPR) repeat protein
MRYAGADTPLVKPARAPANYNIALSFEALGNSEAAINAYDAAVKLARDHEPSQEKLLAKALFNLGALAQREGRFAEASAYYDRIQQIFRANRALDVQALVAKAKLNNAVALMVTGRLIEAEATLQELTFGFIGTDLPGWDQLMQKVAINLNYIRQFNGAFSEEESAETEAQVHHDDD